MPIISNLVRPFQDAATKEYLDKTMFINMLSAPPANPLNGDTYFDNVTGHGYIWTGAQWAIFSSNEKPPTLIPSKDELEKHPSLKQAWEEYIVIRKLLGL